MAEAGPLELGFDVDAEQPTGDFEMFNQSEKPCQRPGMQQKKYQENIHIIYQYLSIYLI